MTADFRLALELWLLMKAWLAFVFYKVELFKYDRDNSVLHLHVTAIPRRCISLLVSFVNHAQTVQDPMFDWKADLTGTGSQSFKCDITVD